MRNLPEMERSGNVVLRRKMRSIDTSGESVNLLKTKKKQTKKGWREEVQKSDAKWRRFVANQKL